MSSGRRVPTLRLRLTLYYVAATVVVLAVYAGSVFLVVSRNASRSLDDQLHGDFSWAVEMVEQRPDATFVWFDGDDSENLDSPWLQVWEPDGDLLYRSSFADSHPLPSASQLITTADRRVVALPSGVTTFRLLSAPSVIGGTPVVIQVARSEALMRRDRSDLLLMLVLGLPLGVAAAGLGGYSLARHALAPVGRMAARARSISAERLSDRLPVDNPDDELGQLAAVFNDAFSRLESSFDQMRRFTADVSHQLRTPLTAIRSVGEVGLRARRDSHHDREVIVSMLEEVDRLASLVERLLVLSRVEMGQAALNMAVLDLGELAEQVAAHLSVLAEEKSQSITTDIEGRPNGVGDPLLLRNALINLVDNAIKHGPAGGRIHIRVAQSGEAAFVDVTDSGCGLTPDARSRLVDRFRLGGSRLPTGDRGSMGLGLSIAKWAVELNGGVLSIERPDGVGTTFRMTLPSAKVRA